jgi:hypothetical protein
MDAMGEVMMASLNLLAESGQGKLFEASPFIVPVLIGTSREMGRQFGALTVDKWTGHGMSS